MANFWESFLNSGLQKPDGPSDPGDPSMPYGPPLWPTPEQGLADAGHYDTRGPVQWFEPQQIVPNEKQGYPLLPHNDHPAPSRDPWPMILPDDRIANVYGVDALLGLAGAGL